MKYPLHVSVQEVMECCLAGPVRRDSTPDRRTDV